MLKVDNNEIYGGLQQKVIEAWSKLEKAQRFCDFYGDPDRLEGNGVFAGLCVDQHYKGEFFDKKSLGINGWTWDTKILLSFTDSWKLGTRKILLRTYKMKIGIKKWRIWIN